MRFLSRTLSDGVSEELVSFGALPGVLWTREGSVGTRPLILMGHGGGQHKKAPDIIRRAHHFVTEGDFAVVAVDVPGHGDRPTDEALDRLAGENQARIDAGEAPAPLIAGFQAMVARRTVPEWRAVLDAVQRLDHVGSGPVGYWGVSLGCGLGVPFVAAEPRVRAAVLGLGGQPDPRYDTASRVTVPVEFLLQWDDERVPRADGLALFDAFASADKTLRAHPGKHADIPEREPADALAFFTRHLR
ncbi:alpha/beta hydrolase [Streptomyces sp. NPDC086010]|uniref:alpha/beta hydrolase n=1 Tax=Streptomyces sp. NPDC086010 TaxID=3365745 RepID=UPI0037D4FA20